MLSHSKELRYLFSSIEMLITDYECFLGEYIKGTEGVKKERKVSVEQQTGNKEGNEGHQVVDEIPCKPPITITQNNPQQPPQGNPLDNPNQKQHLSVYNTRKSYLRRRHSLTPEDIINPMNIQPPEPINCRLDIIE